MANIFYIKHISRNFKFRLHFFIKTKATKTKVHIYILNEKYRLRMQIAKNGNAVGQNSVDNSYFRKFLHIT